MTKSVSVFSRGIRRGAVSALALGWKSQGGHRVIAFDHCTYVVNTQLDFDRLLPPPPLEDASEGFAFATNTLITDHFHNCNMTCFPLPLTKVAFLEGKYRSHAATIRRHCRVWSLGAHSHDHLSGPTPRAR